MNRFPPFEHIWEKSGTVWICTWCGNVSETDPHSTSAASATPGDAA
ncbi:hypothetical protein ACR8AL_09265 [Clavibacter sepedonicus]|uniref:Uncharacterized protein n=1 Tax=Clavibacter sepedonicus TaxID=31964 RepID=B0RJ50_CLASE|nr:MULTISPECIES: hypothetical protein [Clavibacter]MBD5382695.1 hypothetical protein [Clavibacter sp.]UUK67289.1 hypothetical protein LRE50_16145 [Clavibacter sepedonicus]CAQ03240.1 hypothetical protein pCS0057 [Clavibacter sepedonicus]